jgi:hypothetical protein
LMTGSDDTVLDDVSVRLTPSVMMFPLIETCRAVLFRANSRAAETTIKSN